jgi:hypothetical protein
MLAASKRTFVRASAGGGEWRPDMTRKGIAQLFVVTKEAQAAGSHLGIEPRVLEASTVEELDEERLRKFPVDTTALKRPV